MILIPECTVDFYRADERSAFHQSIDTWQSFGRGIVPGGKLMVDNFSVGEAVYRLRRPVDGYFMKPIDGDCQFLVNGFIPTFVGNGNLAWDAYNNWQNVIHETFQTLYAKRPFEMSPEEQRQWDILNEMIDIVSYRNETPIVVRQIGRVTQDRSQQLRQITWVDGRKEQVSFDIMPPEFASYKVGQYFEADVERDPRNGRMRQVRHVQRVHSLPPLPESQLDEFWKSLPSTESLPKSNRDWTQH